MIEAGSFLALSSSVSTTDDFCRNISIIWHGQSRDHMLYELAENDRAAWASVDKLSDRILYAPDLRNVEDLSQANPRQVLNRQELRASLEPVQRVLGDDILSSRLILTPDRLFQAMTKNPWDALMGVRPMIFFAAKIPNDGVLVQFEHSGVCYLGWNMRVALQRLFDCKLILPASQDNSVMQPATIPTPPPLPHLPSLSTLQAPPPKIIKPEVTPKAEQQRYVINHDGTVTDTKTKLMWQRCSVGQNWTGTTCTGDPSTMTLDAANAIQAKRTLLQSVISGRSQAWPAFAGYNDWRLPTIEELRTLVWCSNGTSQEDAWKYGCGGAGNRNGAYQKPTINQEVFPNTPPWQFWSTSASAYSSSLSRAWVVYFGGGCVNDFAGSYSYAVRLVRAS